VVRRARWGRSHYNYFRDYDPQVGRYVESDPIGLDGGENTYAYSDSDPIGTYDPTGQYRQLPGAPATSAEIDALLHCIESRTGDLLIVTSTSKITKSHPAGSPHARGVAVDIRYPNDPGKILCAAGACGAGFALDEKLHPSKNSDGPHIHIQIPKGTKGGRGDLPATAWGSSPCGI
jgi:RHS repeat-associated protein